MSTVYPTGAGRAVTGDNPNGCVSRVGRRERGDYREVPVTPAEVGLEAAPADLVVDPRVLPLLGSAVRLATEPLEPIYSDLCRELGDPLDGGES